MVFDPHYGAGLSTRMYHNKPPTILDIPPKASGRRSGCRIRPTRSAPRASASHRRLPRRVRCSVRWLRRLVTTSSGARRFNQK